METLSHLISNSMTVHRGQSTIRKSEFFLRCGPGVCGHNKKVEEETNKSIIFARQTNKLDYFAPVDEVNKQVNNLDTSDYNPPTFPITMIVLLYMHTTVQGM